MKIEGREIITARTIIATRALIITSSATFAINRYELNTTGWDFLGGGTLDTSDFREASTLIISFLVINLLIHWLGDHYSFKNWFSRSKAYIGSRWGPAGIDHEENILESLKAKVSSKSGLLDIVKQRLSQVESKVTRIGRSQGDLTDDRINELLGSLQDLGRCLVETRAETDKVLEILGDMRSNFEGVSLRGRIIVYGWYLALPLCIAALAIFSNFTRFFTLL